MNKKSSLILILIVIIFLGILFLFNKKEDAEIINYEQTKLIAYNFAIDFIAIAPPENNPEAEERIYDALSKNAKNYINRDSIVYDMTGFFGVQDVPDQGINVENLEIIDDNSVLVVLGFDYSGGKIMKNIHLVIEDGEWKIDKITTRDQETNQIINDIINDDLVFIAEDCENNNGNWLEDFNECEYIEENWCTENKGNFNECESACRHDEEAEICTMECVPVCKF